MGVERNCFLCGLELDVSNCKTSGFCAEQEFYLDSWSVAIAKSFCQLFNLNKANQAQNEQFIRERFQKKSTCTECQTVLRDLDWNFQLLVSLQHKLRNIHAQIMDLIQQNNLQQQLDPESKCFYKLLQKNSKSSRAKPCPIDFNKIYANTSTSFNLSLPNINIKVENDASNDAPEVIDNLDSSQLEFESVGDVPSPDTYAALELKNEDEDSNIEFTSQLDPDYQVNEDEDQDDSDHDQDLDINSNSDDDYLPPTRPPKRSKIKKSPAPVHPRRRKPKSKEATKANRISESEPNRTERKRTWTFKRKADDPYPCFICGNLFDTAEDRNNHKPTCGQFLHCIFPECPCMQNPKQVYVPDQGLALHLNTTHYQTNRLRCTNCYKSWKIGEVEPEFLLQELQTHLNLHRANEEQNQKYNCVLQDCSAELYNTADLMYHVVRVHEDPKIVNLCGICDKTFASPYHLFKHSTYQHLTPEEQKSKCPHCEFRSVRPGDMQYHSLVHVTEKTFKCDACPKAFKNKRDFLYHQKRHDPTTERRFKCTFTGCDKAYFKKNNLKFHEESSHSHTRGYVCEYCSKTYKSSKGLSQHFRLVCKKDFRKKRNP